MRVDGLLGKLPAVLLVLLLGACGGNQVRELQTAQDTLALTGAEKRRWYEANELDKVLRNRGILLEDAAANAYVQNLMDELYPEFAGSIRARIAKSSELNAYALPNGSVYINLGLLARMHNEAQLAMVLGHEAAHFIEQHGLRQREAVDGMVVAGVALTVLTGIPFSGQLMMASAMSGYSQDFERAADQRGFARISERGYDTRQAAEVFRIMREEVEALDIAQPYLYSSHPKLSERVDTLSEMAGQSPNGNGTLGLQRFEREVGHLRGRLLAQYLQEQDFKRLMLILEDQQRRAAYPEYARFYLGEAYRLRGDEGDQEKSLQAYRAALEDAPAFAPTYRALGLQAMQDGDKAQAIEYLQQYLGLNPAARDRKYIQGYLAKLGKAS